MRLFRAALSITDKRRPHLPVPPIDRCNLGKAFTLVLRLRRVYGNASPDLLRSIGLAEKRPLNLSSFTSLVIAPSPVPRRVGLTMPISLAVNILNLALLREANAVVPC